MSDFGKRFLIVANAIRENQSFSRVLRAYKAKTENVDRNSLTLSYTIPSGLCIYCKQSKKPVLAVSSAIALFDELNTSSYFLHDRKQRPGVSVHLSAELKNIANADDEIKITFNTDKIGKTLGFCTMAMYAADGKMIARGHHIKYLPRGFIQDVILVQLFPLLFRILDWLSSNIPYCKLWTPENFSIAMFSRTSSKDGKNYPEVDVDAAVTASVFDSLKLSRADNHTAATSPPLRAAKPPQTPSRDADKWVCYSFDVLPHLLNIPGGLHGGAIAMAVEHAFNLAVKDMLKTESLVTVVLLELSYLASAKVR